MTYQGYTDRKQWKWALPTFLSCYKIACTWKSSVISLSKDCHACFDSIHTEKKKKGYHCQSFNLSPSFDYVAVLGLVTVMCDFLRPHGLWPTRLFCPWAFSRQEYWSGLPCPPPGDLPNPGNEPRSPALQADSFTVWTTREAQEYWSG